MMSAKAYRDKKALPLVEKLKDVVKNRTIKCVHLTEQSKKLTAKMDGQQKLIRNAKFNKKDKFNK